MTYNTFYIVSKYVNLFQNKFKLDILLNIAAVESTMLSLKNNKSLICHIFYRSVLEKEDAYLGSSCISNVNHAGEEN